VIKKLPDMAKDKFFIPVSKMFNMVAGSETGAIIGGALVTPRIPGDKSSGPRLSAHDVYNWFR